MLLFDVCWVIVDNDIWRFVSCIGREDVNIKGVFEGVFEDFERCKVFIGFLCFFYFEYVVDMFDFSVGCFCVVIELSD